MNTLGIDIGGTTIKMGIVEKGIIKERIEVPYQYNQDTLAPSLVHIIQTQIKASYSKIGIASPGRVDDGWIYHACNLNITELPIGPQLEEHLKVPVKVTNDANASTLSELHYGSLRNATNALLITLGTGIGGGIVINRKLYKGSHLAAGEFGHMTYIRNGRLCNCGNKGCFEMYASTKALIHSVKEKTGKILNGKEIHEALIKKETLIEEIFEKYTTHLAEGLKELILILDVDTISLSGGISEMKNLLITPLEKKLPKKVVIKASELGENAGIIGASLLGDDGVDY